MKSTESIELQRQDESKSKEEKQSNKNSSEKREEVKYERVPDTPFAIMKPHNEDWIIICGTEAASIKRFKTKQSAITYINSKPWEIITVASAIIANSNKRDN